MAELLRLESFRLWFTGAGRPVLDGLDLAVGEGESVALVGPSGAGKTMVARAALGLLPRAAHSGGRLLWEGREGSGIDGGWAALRGRGLTWLPQEPLAALNPLLTIGAQVAESARLHQGLDRAAARDCARDLLAELELPDPDRVLRAWPHELSGGMRQRALLAATLACRPRLLIADEPTSSLDTTVQRELLSVLARVRRARGMAMLFITHDRHLVPLVASRCLELRDGRAVEVPLRPGPAPAGSRVAGAPRSGQGAPVLAARGIVVRHRGQALPAVAGVDLELCPGRATALVGESAAGKSSLARVLAGHLRPSAGEVSVDGRARDPRFRGPDGRAQRRRVQLLFQDAGASLDPRQRVGDALGEACGGREVAIAPLLAEVGLAPELAARHPHALSGGQRQRVALARCLAADPAVLVADEPTSALDAGASRQVLDLLRSVMDARALAVLVVTHDLDAALSFCDELVVMHGGVVIERAAPADGTAWRHPHVRRLLASRPRVLAAAASTGEVQRRLPDGPVAGSRSGIAGLGIGCPAAAGCPLRNDTCLKELPPLREVSPGHWLRCPPAAELPPPQFIDTL